MYFVDGKLGAGILTLKKQAMKSSDTVNQKRARRGMHPRAVRAAVIGFPNVGKSAIINRLLGRRMAKSMNLPGVTRSLQWVRIGGNEISQEDTLELLDSPGIIPAKELDQNCAVNLAICNDIGEASYDRVVIAEELCDRLNYVFSQQPKYVEMQRIRERYQLNFSAMKGEEIVYQIAEKMYSGNMISAADRLLGDFRRGFLGKVSLEIPPSLIKDSSVDIVHDERSIDKDALFVNKHDYFDESRGEYVFKEKSNLDIGRGNYEGW